MTDVDVQPPRQMNSMPKVLQDGDTKPNSVNDHIPWWELWTDGLICAFELVEGHRKLVHQRSLPNIELTHIARNGHRVFSPAPSDLSVEKDHRPSHAGDVLDHRWVPIGWSRIAELIQRVHSDSDACWENEDQGRISYASDDEYTVADVVAPYRQVPGGPTWWFHVLAGCPSVDAWLSSARWMYPAIRTALRDEGRLISDRMKYLLYEVPVRVAGGLLFELLGQSVGDPLHDEEDIPVVLRSWQAQNFLLTATHVKGLSSNINVLGVTEVQVIRVKWSLHAREEIILELLRHLRGNATRIILERERESAREMLEEQEAVRGRLFNIQDVMQNTARAQDRSVRITHNLAVFGGVSIVLSIILDLFGIKLDGIPGAQNTPYAFGLFAGLLFFIGFVLVGIGLMYLGLTNSVTSEKVKARKLELQQVVSVFQHEAAQHGKVRKVSAGTACHRVRMQPAMKTTS